MTQTKKPIYEKESKLWKGIAIAGIWIAVGVSSIFAPGMLAAVVLSAVFATLFVVMG